MYLYHPSWVFADFDLTQLEEPNPATADCLPTGNGACAMPAYAAWTASSKELATTAPRFVAMLKRFELPLADVEGMLQAVDVENEDVDDVAARYVADHPELVRTWVGAAA